MDMHCSNGISYELITKHDIKARHDVLKAIHCRREQSKMQKNKVQHAKSYVSCGSLSCKHGKLTKT